MTTSFGDLLRKKIELSKQNAEFLRVASKALFEETFDRPAALQVTNEALLGLASRLQEGIKKATEALANGATYRAAQNFLYMPSIPVSTKGLEASEVVALEGYQSVLKTCKEADIQISGFFIQGDSIALFVDAAKSYDPAIESKYEVPKKAGQQPAAPQA